jgi:hypothetical protein
VKSKKLKTEWSDLWKSQLKSGRNFQGHLADDDDEFKYRADSKEKARAPNILTVFVLSLILSI